MTAPMGNTGRDTSAASANSQSSEQNVHRGLASTNKTREDENSSPQANGCTVSTAEDGERPELDAFVQGFYDGDKFTDVDSRVWV
ncbi:hypothetical protein BGX29_007058 [Mortierella sp. GBA35]|nr:hypothetical protein BGX23_004063 [Mortierella sp. AD031]KAF9108768.1 hypothetical protein BGX29_007058 [Mortierella sp. GBA35]KAG0220273.1 hypothetical protein BGX33_003533 [Mortierella sp. NVP41]